MFASMLAGAGRYTRCVPSFFNWSCSSVWRQFLNNQIAPEINSAMMLAIDLASKVRDGCPPGQLILELKLFVLNVSQQSEVQFSFCTSSTVFTLTTNVPGNTMKYKNAKICHCIDLSYTNWLHFHCLRRFGTMIHRGVSTSQSRVSFSSEVMSDRSRSPRARAFRNVTCLMWKISLIKCFIKCLIKCLYDLYVLNQVLNLLNFGITARWTAPQRPWCEVERVELEARSKSEP